MKEQNFIIAGPFALPICGALRPTEEGRHNLAIFLGGTRVTHRAVESTLVRKFVETVELGGMVMYKGTVTERGLESMLVLWKPMKDVHPDLRATELVDPREPWRGSRTVEVEPNMPAEVELGPVFRARADFLGADNEIAEMIAHFRLLLAGRLPESVKAPSDSEVVDNLLKGL